jgi:hypothetical protein
VHAGRGGCDGVFALRDVKVVDMAAMVVEECGRSDGGVRGLERRSFDIQKRVSSYCSKPVQLTMHMKLMGRSTWHSRPERPNAAQFEWGYTRPVNSWSN